MPAPTGGHHDAGDPARRAVECAERHDGLGGLTGMAFESAVLLGLERADDAGLAQVLRGRVGQAHELVALDAFGADLVRVLHDSVQNVAHGVTLPGYRLWEPSGGVVSR